MITGKDLWPNDVLTHDERGISFDPDRGSYTGAPTHLFAALETSALRFPDKPAVVLENGGIYTFEQLKHLSVDTASRLSRHGVTKGSKIGLLLDNSVELFIALYAVSRLEAVAVMLPGKLKTAALIELVEHSKPDLIIVEPERLNLFEKCSYSTTTMSDIQTLEPSVDCLPKIEPQGDDLSLVMFTSGTSNMPKTVAISNDNIIQAAVSYERVFNLDENDRLIFGVPLYHVTGVVAIIAQITLTGCTLYLQRRFNPDRFLKWAREIQATYVHASPTVFELMLRAWPDGFEIPSIKILACGAANMPSSRILRLKKKLRTAEFRTIYGLTETTSPATIFPVDAANSEHIGASGWPIPGVDLRIIADNGCEADYGKIGEIEVRGSTVCLGYIDTDGKIEKMNWLSTGDLGFIDDYGFLYVVDRKKDQINRGGEKIYPHVVEEAISNVEGVVDTCVVGVEDELYGEIPAAIYVASSEISPSFLTAELKKNLASYSVPSIMFQVDEIPRTAGMKTDRKGVKRLLRELTIDKAELDLPPVEGLRAG